MKHILVYCNTYYQLLVAIQLQLTLKQEDKVSVLLTDESRGAEEIAARLKASGFFHGVFFWKTRTASEQVNAAYKLRCLQSGIFGSVPEDMPKSYICDELIGYNLDLATHGVYASLKRRNKAMVCNAVEEGLLSYRTPESTSGLLRAIQSVRKALGRENLRQSVKQLYCFNPGVYRGSLEPVAIPRLDCSNETLRRVLQQVFLKDQVLEPYTQKYIYLPCIYDMEGGAPIGELALAQALAQQVGKENLLTKPHPRDDADKYRAAGVKVDTNSSVPFEVLCILQDLSQKVLITTLSGSLLNVSALLEKPPVCYYAYPLCELGNNPMAQHFCGVIRSYLSPESGLETSNIQLLDKLSQL